MVHRKKVLTALFILLPSLFLFAGGAGEPKKPDLYPVPRADTLVIETDMKYQYLNTANPLKGFGTQWGSGWHQLANEWDWYMNYATGEQVLWRTTGWDYSPDHMQLTWHVRQGVAWNDGQPYTAQDIAYTFQLWMKDPTLSGAESAANLSSVEATDDYTVIFKFKNADYRFHNNMRMSGGGNIVAKHIYEKQDPKTFANWPPVETGPYKLKNYYADKGFYVWARDDNYWGTKAMGKKPGPAYAIFRSASASDIEVDEFVKGNVDMPLAETFTLDMIRAAEKKWNHTVRAPYTDAVSQGIAAFNTARYPMSDREFRWALQYLVDRPKWEKGYTMADSTAQTVWPWPNWKTLDKWEVPSIMEKYGAMLRYDPAAAEKELDRIGFKKGSDGKRKLPDGKGFSLTLVSRASPDPSSLHANDFSDELRKAGIDNVVKIFQADFTEQQFMEGLHDIAFDVLDANTALSNDPWRFIDGFSSKWSKPLGEMQDVGGDHGKSRLKDPALDAIADKMAVTDPASPDYLKLVEQAMNMWYYDLPAVPGVERNLIQTVSDKYWTNWPKKDKMYQVPFQTWPSLIFVTFELKPVKQ